MGRTKEFGIAVACMACCGLNALAQNPATPSTIAGQETKSAQQPGVQQPGSVNSTKQHENLMASCLVHDNQAEIALGQMAREKSQSDGVKKFASMMIQDHQEALKKFQRYAPNAGELSINQNSQTPTGRSNDENRPAEGNANVRASTTGQQNPGQANDPAMEMAKMQRELAQQCLSDTQAKLAKADDDDFDKCYVGMQIAMHAGMKSKLTVFTRHASGEFKQALDQALQTTTTHLEHAESLMKDLDSDEDSTQDSK